MVGLVLVSHNRALAQEARTLAMGVCPDGKGLPIAIAGGVGEEFKELGTDATDVLSAIEEVYSEDGVLILMDLGSAVISARTALEFLDENQKNKVMLCSAPLVEGAVSAAVQISTGASLLDVKREALCGLDGKQENIGDNNNAPRHCGLDPQSPPMSEIAGQARNDDKGGFLEQPKTDRAERENVLSFRFTIEMKNGLHARPAADLVKSLSGIQADAYLYNVTKNKRVSARSVNKLLTGNFVLGDIAEFEASGQESQKAIEIVKALVDNNFGEIKVKCAKDEKQEKQKQLLTIVGGIAIGKLVKVGAANAVLKENINDIEKEIAKFKDAIEQVKLKYKNNRAGLLLKNNKSEAEIFEGLLGVIDDEEIINEICDSIKKEKVCAAYLYSKNMKAAADEMRADGGYLGQRAVDILSVMNEVVEILSNSGRQARNDGERGERQANSQIILGAPEIAASMIGMGGLAGIVSLEGGASSHAGILARGLAIPFIAGFDCSALEDGITIIVDGDNNKVIPNPSEEEIKSVKDRISNIEKEKAIDFEFSKKTVFNADGQEIIIRGNAGDLLSARQAKKTGAQGIGLLRTEFLFLDAVNEPTIKEQKEKLKEIFENFDSEPITVRLFDAGGDKPLLFLNQDKESNPFLGVRGVRLYKRYPDFFLKSIKAVLIAGYGFNIKIMAPMIDTKEEIDFCKDMIQKACGQLQKEGETFADYNKIKFGIMIETPASVMMADELAKEVDFFSIGTNDLTQYCMAAERGNKNLADLTGFFQPSVLKMIKMTVDAAKNNKISVSVCGEAAGDTKAAKTLIELGVRELSMSASCIGKVKREISNCRGE
ncbi:MAG: phosphoenolpyruvate--protein phosphotransferase [Endomicrobium sp.]|jgi:phosphocarrier protein FPr|nr:phosphoenolpyruvate--protein phosphotransferase [Endomicrobium sp.]